MLNFGTGIMYATAIQNSAGVAVANATPVQFGSLQDISGDFSFEEKTLYGSRQHPIAIGRGKAKFAFKAKTASFTGGILSNLIFGSTPTTGIKSAVENFAASVPATTTYTITVTPPASGTYLNDLGVLLSNTSYPLTKVAATPAAGQYSVSALGVYTFNVAQASASVAISYEYSAVSTGTDSIITITNDLMGQAPMFQANLTTAYQGKILTLKLNQCLASQFSLPMKNDDFTVPEFDFTAMSDASGTVGYIYTSE